MGRRKRRERLLAAGPQPLTVDRLDRKGLGVGERDGRVVRVFGVLPGEEITYQPTERRKGEETGPLVELLRPAPERIEPGCPHFGTCGGCTLQHLGAADRMRRAQADLAELLRAEGVEPRAWAPPLVGEQWGYRRKARLGVRRVEGKGRVLVGFREVDKRFVADLERCPVLAPPAGDLLRPLGELIDATSLVRQVPQVEVAVGDDATALILRVLEAPTDEDLEKFRAFEARHGVRIFLQPGGLDTVAPLDGGAATLSCEITDHLTLRFAPTDFVQVHASLNRAMIAQAMSWLELSPDMRVLDLFCGSGNFTLPLATRVPDGRVLGVEGDDGLVRRGRENATRIGVTNVAFESANLYESLDDVPLDGDGDHAGRGWDRVLLDPPRSGAAQVASLLSPVLSPRVVYVACGPQALARDASLLLQRGYVLARVGVMDMFPQTGHYESMACFVPSDATCT